MSNEPQIEVLKLVSRTSHKRDPNVRHLWVHEDLNGNEFADIRQTLTAEELRQITDDIERAAGEFPILGEDEDPDSDGYGWERRALAGAY